MSSFWSNLTGHDSGEKPPSGRSRSVSRTKDREPPIGRPATRERPQDGSRKEDDPEKHDARSDEEKGDGCLNMSRLAEQVLGRGGRGVLRVGLLPAFTRAGRTGSLPHPKRQPSTDPAGLSTPTPPPTPNKEHEPPVPESPKPKVKGVGQKRAASSSPTRDKRRSFRGISRDRLPPFPHLPHMPSLPPQLRNLLHRGGGEDNGGQRVVVQSPSKPSRRPGPVGRTWVKVYDDITFMDDLKGEEEMYPMMGYTGHPPVVPDPSPLPIPPTPPPPKTRQRRPSTASEYDNVPKDCSSPDQPPELEVLDRRSSIPEASAQTADPQSSITNDELKNYGGQGRGRERFRGRRQKRTGTPIRIGREEHDESQVEAIEATRLAALEAEIIVASQEEEDYIIPQALQPPKPPRGQKTYNNYVEESNSQPQQEGCAEPLKPHRVKVYDEMTFRCHQQLGVNMNTIPQTPQNEAVTQQEVQPQQQQELEEAAPQQVMQREAVPQQEDMPQEEAVETVTQKEVVTQEAVSQEEAKTQEDVLKQRVIVEEQEVGEGVIESLRQEGEPPRPRRGLKVYETVDMRRRDRDPEQYVSQAEIDEKVSEIIGENVISDATENWTTGEEPQRPSRGHKIYASVIIQPDDNGGQAVMTEITLDNGNPLPALLKADSSEALDLPIREVKADSEQKPRDEGQRQQQQQQQDVEATVPPYARVLKGSGTRELRPILASDNDEVPPPIPPKKKGLRTISPQLEELFPPRPPRHLKPRVGTSVRMMNGEDLPSRPARGSKIYESVKTSTPKAPKRYFKVMHVENVEDYGAHPPAKPSRHALHHSRRRRKNQVRRELDDNEQRAMTAKLTRDSRKAAHITLASDQDNYENIIISGGLPRLAARTRTRPLPPPPPPPKKGKIQQRYRKQQQQQQQQQQQLQQQQQSSSSQIIEENGVAAVVVNGKVGSHEKASPTLGERLPPASRPAAPGRASVRRRGTAKLQNDINENLKTIESSFATLDTVLKSLQTYSRSSPPRTVVRGSSEETCDHNNILAPPTPASTQPAAAAVVQTASPTVSKIEEATLFNTGPDTGTAFPVVTLDQSRTDQVKHVVALITNEETIAAQSCQSDAENIRLTQRVGHESVESEIAKADDLPQETFRFVEFEGDVSEKGTSKSGERGFAKQQTIIVSLGSDAKGVPKLSEQVPAVKNNKVSSEERGTELHEKNKCIKPHQQSESLEQPLREAKDSVNDPKKVSTVTQTSVKFQAGKTLFETAVKIGDCQGTEEHAAVKSDVHSPATLSSVKDVQRYESLQQLEYKDIENPQQRAEQLPQYHPNRADGDREKVPQISLKFEEEKTLFETEVKVGESQCIQKSKNLQQPPVEPEKLQQSSQQSEIPQQHLQQPRTPKQPDPSAKDPEKVTTVPQTSVKFQEGKTFFQTAVKIGDCQGTKEHAAVKTDVHSPATLSSVRDVQRFESLQQPEYKDIENPQQQASSAEQLPQQHLECANRDPEKVPTVPQASLKFEEGKTLFETKVKVGESQSIHKSEHLQQPPVEPEKPYLSLQQSETQQPLQQLGTPQQPDPSDEDPGKVVTVLQTALKFQEEKTLFETSTKDGYDQPKSSQQSPVRARITQQSLEAQERHQQTAEQGISPPLALREVKSSEANPEKVSTVPQTSVKFQEGKNIFQTAVKIGDDQGITEQTSVKSDLQTSSTSLSVTITDSQKPESLHQRKQEQFESTAQSEILPQPRRQIENAQHPTLQTENTEQQLPQQPESNSQEGKTLSEAAVKVGEDQDAGLQEEVSTAGVQVTDTVKTETEAGEPRNTSSASAKGKTVYETLFRVEAIKRSKPTEVVGEGEAATDHRKQQRSAEINVCAAVEVKQLGRSGGNEKPANRELQEGVANLASLLQGIRSTLESAICNISPTLTPAHMLASASNTTNIVEAVVQPGKERPSSPAQTRHLPSRVIFQPDDGRRASWSGGQQGMAPESQSDSFSGRRSLSMIFSSFGKGGRYARRQKVMAPSKISKRPEDTRSNSQFYVGLSKDNTADCALPEDNAACHLEDKKVSPQPTERKQEQQQQKSQPQPLRLPISPGGTPVHGVLVLPAAARQSSAYRVRVRLFLGDSSPPSSPSNSMGAAPSTYVEEERRETLAPNVAQQYGSMLAELTNLYSTRHYEPKLSYESGGQEYSDSGVDGEGEEEEKDSKVEVEITSKLALQRGDRTPTETPKTISSSMTPNVCETNQPATNSTDQTPAPSPELTSQEKRDRKIFLIAQEVMTSERVFVDVLRLLNVDFRQFVCDWREGSEDQGNHRHQDVLDNPVLPLHELDKILNYLPQLQNLNEEILSDLEVRIADWDRRKKISDVIVRKGPFLKLYSAYIREFQTQCDHLDHCCQTYPAFARALKTFEFLERCTKLNLKHYMLKPVQRIPQYRLLLEEYLKYLPEKNPDYVDTQTALAVVANVAAHANDTMKQGSNFMKLLALQDRLNSGGGGGAGEHEGVSNSSNSSRGPRYELLRPGRYLLKEGELLKLCRREMQTRYFILLSDVLLYTSFATSNPGGALRLNYELPLEGMRVETPRAEDFKNEFSVISTSRSFTLQASSAEERNEWLKALREAIADNASRRSTFLQVKLQGKLTPSFFTLGKQAPVWTPDYRVTMCQQCTATFTLTFRRHHCRACGKVVCDHCSANRAPLHYKKDKVARVCDTCFEVLQQDFEKKSKGFMKDELQQLQQHHEEGERRQPDHLKSQFRRGIREPYRNRNKRKVPERLMEVCANDTTSQMSGYLQMMVRRSWRRGWFVLKDRVLYEYRAPQDVCALYSLPVLGYLVKAMNKRDQEVSEDVDNCLAIQLTHPNQPPLVFQTDSPHMAEKWIEAMKEAVVLT